MTKRRVVAIILACLLGVMILDFKFNGEAVFTNLITDEMKEDWEQIENIDYDCYPKVEKSETLVFEINDIKEFKLYNPCGDVKVVADDVEVIKVDYRIKVYSNSDVAYAFIEDVEATANEQGNKLKLSSMIPRRIKGIRGVKIDYTIKAPKNILLDIEGRHGKLLVKGFDKSAKLRSRHGRFEISEMGSRLDVELAHSNGVLKDIGNNLELDARHSEFDIEGVAGDAKIESEHGEINIVGIDGELEIDCRHDDIKLQDIGGEMKVDAVHCELVVEGLRNGIDIESEYSDVDMALAVEMKDYLLDVVSYRGDIYTELPFEVKEEKSERTLQGKEGKALVEILVESHYGELNIK